MKQVKNRFILISKDGLRQEVFDVYTVMPTIHRYVVNREDVRLGCDTMRYPRHTTRVYNLDTTNAIDIGDAYECINFYREI